MAVRVGVVLGAGGVVGEAFHRGVLHGLRDCTGFDARRADALVGTSAGSLVAASLRAPRGTSASFEEELADEPVAIGTLPGVRRFRTGALLHAVRRPHRARRGTIATSLLPAGTVSAEFVVGGLRDRFGARWPSEPLWIVAVRRHDGRRVVFGRAGAPRTDVARAVAASCAIPGYFRPVVIDGLEYVDGGVHSPTNAAVLAGAPLDAVVVSSPMSVDLRGLRPKLDLGLRLLWHRDLRKEAHAVSAGGVPVLAVEPCSDVLSALGINPLSGRRVDEIEDAARAHTCDLLGRSRHAEVRDVLTQHAQQAV